MFVVVFFFFSVKKGFIVLKNFLFSVTLFTLGLLKWCFLDYFTIVDLNKDCVGAYIQTNFQYTIFFIRKPFFCPSLDFLNIMLELTKINLQLFRKHDIILIYFFHRIFYITWFSIASLFKNMKYISINIIFNVHFKYVPTEYSPTITASCYTFQSILKAWTHTRTACIFWCFTINYNGWNLAYRQVLSQDQFSSALTYLSFGTNPDQVGSNIRDLRCSIDRFVNELVKHEIVSLFQMEADFLA